MRKCFRPLTGIMVLIFIWHFMMMTLCDCFRPLAGIMVLINIRRMLGIAKSSGFRPLAGIMVLIQTVLIDGLIAGRLVSVPLRGLWFLSRLNFLTNLKKFKFPSPYGDYGSYHDDYKLGYAYLVERFPSPYGDYGSYRRSYFSRAGLVAFPSPYGDYGSYHYIERFINIQRNVVSVPLRGLWFLSYD